MNAVIQKTQIQLRAIPALNDNYIWCFHRTDSPRTWVVDPGQSAPAVDYLKANTLQLAGILITHHHPDHTGGVRQLINDSWHGEGDCPVYGNRQSAHADRISHINQPLDAGDHFDAAGLRFRSINVPGHTCDHVAFFTETPFILMDNHVLQALTIAACGTGKPGENEPSAGPLLFCGDTLFSAGCGRLFEGTPEQMLSSLDVLAALPPSTLVCCGHEYTLANLAFSAGVWPDNSKLPAYRKLCERLRETGVPTLPSSLAIERSINPFLNPEATRLALNADSAATDVDGESVASRRLRAFTRLRAAKDRA